MLGENNEKLNKIIKDIYKIINDDKIAVKINLIEVKKIYAHAQSIANLIKEELKKRTRYLLVIRNLLSKLAAEREVRGAKIEVSGRLDGSEYGQTKKVVHKEMKLSTIDSNIEEGEAEVITSYGKIGIKVLIYKGKI
jgi:small subunit ribosomal protein S3